MDLPYPAPGSCDTEGWPISNKPHWAAPRNVSVWGKCEIQMQAVIRNRVHFCTAAPSPLPPRRHTRADTVCACTPGSRPQPSLAPGDYRARLGAAARTQKESLLWNQTPCKVAETARACRSRKPAGRNFPKHLCPAPARRRAGHIPGATRAQGRPPGQKDHSRSWTVKTRVSIRLSCGLTWGTDEATSLKTLLQQDRPPALLTAVASAGRRGGWVSITTGAQQGSSHRPELCRPPTPPGGSQGLLTVRLLKSRT